MSKTFNSKKVILEGRGQLTLKSADHIATGGEGSVFRKSNTVVKLYTDDKYMKRFGIVDKIRLLSEISHPYIVSPKGVVYDSKQKPVGYWMPFVRGEALPRLFTNDFRSRIGFTDQLSGVLVERMREAVSFAHDKGAVLVDANELNYLAYLKGKNSPEPRLIDVDSWAIGRFGANVIMPSIRDWSSKDFDENTDWFSWGIVTFQLYTGIHPYKGTANGFKRGDIEARMRANVSVFHNGVRVNASVRDFSRIPSVLLAWYENTFENGERGTPPSVFDTRKIAVTAKTLRYVTTPHSGSLVFEKLFSRAGGSAIRVFPCGVVLMGSGDVVDIANGRTIARKVSTDAEIVSEGGRILIGETSGFRFVGSDGNEEKFSIPVSGNRILRANNRLFVVGDALTEIKFTKLGDKFFLTAGSVWGILSNSTQWFDGVGVQDALGASYLIVPFGDRSCAQVRVPELDEIKPLSAKSGNKFAVVVGVNSSGVYKKLEFAFGSGYSTYKLWQGSVDTSEINMAILPRGVCATVVDDGKINIFVPSTGEIKKIKDKDITTDMALAEWNNSVVYIKDGALWRLRMK